MGRFKFRNPPVPLAGEAFKRPTPRDCKHYGIPEGEANRWEVLARFPDGRAQHLRQKGEPDALLR